MDRTVVIHVEADREARVGSYETWWDVPVAEVSGDAIRRRGTPGELRAGAVAERWYL